MEKIFNDLSAGQSVSPISLSLLCKIAAITDDKMFFIFIKKLFCLYNTKGISPILRQIIVSAATKYSDQISKHHWIFILNNYEDTAVYAFNVLKEIDPGNTAYYFSTILTKVFKLKWNLDIWIVSEYIRGEDREEILSKSFLLFLENESNQINKT